MEANSIRGLQCTTHMRNTCDQCRKRQEAAKVQEAAKGNIRKQQKFYSLLIVNDTNRLDVLKICKLFKAIFSTYI